MISVQFMQKVMLLRACLLCMLLMFSVFQQYHHPFSDAAYLACWLGLAASTCY
jgi:hypothetical protein